MIRTNKYIFLMTLFLVKSLDAHCQIPCGIYDDAIRIIQIKENFKTIEKSISKIIFLSSDSTPLSAQQLVRWTQVKEDHASKIQKIISEYFLTQRINEKNDNYIKQVTLLQRLLVTAMKCKQTTNSDYIKEGDVLLKLFCEKYFDAHGLDHLSKITN